MVDIRRLDTAVHDFAASLDRLTALNTAADDAVDASLPADDDGNHKTVVADGDEILLQVLAMGFGKAFEGFVDEMALLFAIAAEAAKSHAGIVGKRSVGQEFSAQFTR